MFIFIIMIISLLLTTGILFYTKVQVKERANYNIYWCTIDWKDTNTRQKWKLWLILLNYIICLIPIFNIIWTAIIVINYFKQLDGPYSNHGTNLTVTRIVFTNKFTKWLTKEI